SGREPSERVPKRGRAASPYSSGRGCRGRSRATLRTRPTASVETIVEARRDDPGVAALGRDAAQSVAQGRLLGYFHRVQLIEREHGRNEGNRGALGPWCAAMSDRHGRLPLYSPESQRCRDLTVGLRGNSLTARTIIRNGSPGSGVFPLRTVDVPRLACGG